MTEKIFLIDSSAWIEYLNGTGLGQKVQKIVEDENNIVLTPNIVGAEVISKLSREEKDTEEAITAIKTLSIPPKENQAYYFEAGKEHSVMRKKFKGTSLADAIIKIIAQKNNAILVTKDFHLKGKNTVFIG